MALFTDTTAVGIEDLTSQDSGLLEIAEVEGINLTTKLALAQEEVGLELQGLFERTRMNDVVGFYGSGIELTSVVATPPVRLWLVHQTLMLVYRDAYFSQLNDRYKAKWNEFSSLARWAKNKLIETGVALVTDPIPQAGPPTADSASGAENGSTSYLSISFVNRTGEEGKPSVPVAITSPDGSVPDIRPGNAPANALGWNLYCGLSPDAMYLQNESPLEIASDFTFFPSSALTSGRLPGDGQVPNVYRAIPRRLQRG